MRESILAIFEYGDWYEDLNVRGRVVVDVGAYIGDSAIYFALRGARKVVAVEPHPGAYEVLLEKHKAEFLRNNYLPHKRGASKQTR
jgi:FkbM family methyltransferase